MATTRSAGVMKLGWQIWVVLVSILTLVLLVGTFVVSLAW